MRRRLFIASAASCIGAPALAQEPAYPVRPINLVVPFPAGGAGDLYARILAQRFGDNFGPWVVLNKPGGAGIPAAEAVKRAAPDGYTLLQGHVGMFCVNPALYPTLSYNPLNDFAAVSILFQLATVIVVRADSPATSLSGLVNLASKKSEGVTYASVGIGTGTHLLGERMRLSTRTQMIHVPFQGSSPALQNLLAGRVDFALDGVSNVKPLVDAGKLRVLAVASESRQPLIPGVPTTAQVGFTGLESDFWVGMFAPKSTPTAIVAKLQSSLKQVSQSPKFADEMGERGFNVLTSTPAELSDRIARDGASLGRIVKDAGIKL